MSQLALNLTAQKLSYADIPLNLINPHPLNPRPYSEKYGCRVDEEKVDELIHSIATRGYDESEPIKVRQIGDRFQLIRGHHRWIACQQLSHETIPGVVRDMSDEEAVIALITEQGRPVEGWEAAEHAHASCGAYGKGGLLTVSEYAERVGKTQVAISQQILSVTVMEKCITMVIHFECKQDFKDQVATRTARVIGSLNEEDWPLAVEAFITEGWTAKELDAAIKAIKSVYALDCPEWLQSVIKLDKVKRQAIADPKRVRDAESCINAAVKAYESLSPVDVEIPDGDELKTEAWDLQAQFIEALSDLGPMPTPGKFPAIVDRLNKAVAAVNAQAEKWKEQRAKGDELARLKAEREAREAQLKQQYAPVGILGDIRETLPALVAGQRNSFDLVLTDPPYLLSNDGITARGNSQVSVNKNFADDGNAIAPESWMPLCLQLMKPGGVLVFTCTEHLGITAKRIEGLGFEYLEKLYWGKQSAPPRLTPTGHRACVEEIWVCRKPGDAHFFNYELLKEKYWEGKQASNYLEFEQCSGNERLKNADGKNLHDTQKPLDLWIYLLEAYSPTDGKVLDPFGGTATTAVAAKANQRFCVWCELDKVFFEAANQRLEKTPFFFEER